MPKFNRDPLARKAIWGANKKACQYCKEPILFPDLEIDHVVPEDARGNRSLFVELRLSEDYDVDALSNLVPACGPCNNRKRERIIPELILMTLDSTNARLEKTLQILEKLKHEDTLARQRAHVISAIALGAVTPAELREWTTRDPILFQSVQLEEPMDFSDGSRRLIDRGELEQLWTAPMDPVELQFGEMRLANSLKEYVELRKAGFEPPGNLPAKIANVVYDGPIAVLQAIELCRVPVESHIAIPRESIASLGRLPASVAAVFDGEDEINESMSVLDLVNSGKCLISEIRPGHLRFEAFQGFHWITEYLRTDLDGDGEEEILAFRYHQLNGGTLGGGRPIVIRLREPDSMFELEMWRLPWEEQ